MPPRLSQSQKVNCIYQHLQTDPSFTSFLCAISPTVLCTFRTKIGAHFLHPQKAPKTPTFNTFLTFAPRFFSIFPFSPLSTPLLPMPPIPSKAHAPSTVFLAFLSPRHTTRQNASCRRIAVFPPCAHLLSENRDRPRIPCRPPQSAVTSRRLQANGTLRKSL